MRQPRLFSRRLRATVGAAVVAAAALAGAASLAVVEEQLARQLPAPATADAVDVSAVVLDRDGLLLRPFATADDYWRLPVTEATVDPDFLAMLLAYEDRRFYRHSGVDGLALLRAAGQFAFNRRIVSGGSTLTMQVARLIEANPTRDLAAKLRQIVHARRLERDLDKREILTLYLHLAPYGGNLQGIRAASLAYFGKEPGRLTTAEAALLVALPQSPETRRPDRYPEAARQARDRVLDRLVDVGTITAESAAAAKREPVPTGRRPFPMLAPHRALASLAAAPSTRVHRLTVERNLQARLQQLAADRAVALGDRVSVAILAVEVGSGAIAAWVGSPDLLDEARRGHVDMVEAVRSPGSTLKPLIYGLAFEQGLAHPETLIEDRPTAFGAYLPVNFDGHSRGTVTVRRALVESLNVPAIAVLDAVGPARLVARLARAGATPRLPDRSAAGLAIGLGGIGISLRDLVALYAAIGNGGRPVRLHDDLAAALDMPVVQAPVLDRLAAWYVADCLAGVPPPYGAAPGRIAYKTGTSYGYRDAWAIGFDGRHVIGVWVGRPDGAPVPGLSGAGAAAPVLFDAFARLGQSPAPLPAAPEGALTGGTAGLPPPLRRFRDSEGGIAERDPAPQIAFPPNGVELDLGPAGRRLPVVVKLRDGVPPFTWMANGRPFARSAFARSEPWQPDGPGFVTLSVIDAAGRADRVTVYVD